MRKAERTFGWLRKSLSLSPAKDEPLLLPGSVQLTVDLFGTDRYVEQLEEQVVGGSQVSPISTAIVPDGFVDCIIAASISHSDPATRNLTLGVFRAVQIVALVGSSPTPTNLRLALNRAFFLAPGYALTAESDVLAVGAVLTLRRTWIRVPIGEAPRIG